MQGPGGRLAGRVQSRDAGVRGDSAQRKVRAGDNRRAEVIVQQPAQFGREKFQLLDAVREINSRTAAGIQRPGNRAQGNTVRFGSEARIARAGSGSGVTDHGPGSGR